MHGKNENGRGQYQCLQQTFEWVKGEGRPRAGSMAIMMNFMHYSEHLRQMHPTVNPIIVGFVNEHG